MCVFMIDKHFDEPEYIMSLVSSELSIYPKQQMQFLKTYVVMKEDKISQVI